MRNGLKEVECDRHQLGRIMTAFAGVRVDSDEVEQIFVAAAKIACMAPIPRFSGKKKK